MERSKELFQFIKKEKTAGRTYADIIKELPNLFGMPSEAIGDELLGKIGMSRNQWDVPSISMFMKYNGFHVNPHYKKRTKAEIKAAKRAAKFATTEKKTHTAPKTTNYKTPQNFALQILESNLPRETKLVLLEGYLD